MQGEATADREEHGFHRTACACAFCKAPCRHIPGALDPADLPRLCPEGHDLFAWAEQHLRALTDKPCPTLVPARGPDGACHWHFGGKCAVHDRAPYGCAFFDAHMPEEEVRRRSEATVQARREDAAVEGPYYRLWRYLCDRGLTTRSGDRAALAEDVVKIRRRLERRARPRPRP